MIVDWGLSIWDIIKLLGIAAGFMWQWFSLQSKMAAAEKAAQEATLISMAAKEALADLKLEVIKDFASIKHLQEVEQRLSGSIGELTSEIRQLRNFLMEGKRT